MADPPSPPSLTHGGPSRPSHFNHDSLSARKLKLHRHRPLLSAASLVAATAALAAHVYVHVRVGDVCVADDDYHRSPYVRTGHDWLENVFLGNYGISRRDCRGNYGISRIGSRIGDVWKAGAFQMNETVKIGINEEMEDEMHFQNIKDEVNEEMEDLEETKKGLRHERHLEMIEFRKDGRLEMIDSNRNMGKKPQPLQQSLTGKSSKKKEKRWTKLRKINDDVENFYIGNGDITDDVDKNKGDVDKTGISISSSCSSSSSSSSSSSDSSSSDSSSSGSSSRSSSSSEGPSDSSEDAMRENNDEVDITRDDERAFLNKEAECRSSKGFGIMSLFSCKSLKKSFRKCRKKCRKLKNSRSERGKYQLVDVSDVIGRLGRLKLNFGGGNELNAGGAGGNSSKQGHAGSLGGDSVDEEDNHDLEKAQGQHLKESNNQNHQNNQQKTGHHSDTTEPLLFGSKRRQHSSSEVKEGEMQANNHQHLDDASDGEDRERSVLKRLQPSGHTFSKSIRSRVGRQEQPKPTEETEQEQADQEQHQPKQTGKYKIQIKADSNKSSNDLRMFFVFSSSYQKMKFTNLIYYFLSTIHLCLYIVLIKRKIMLISFP
jgi:hypothetical protein